MVIFKVQMWGYSHYLILISIWCGFSNCSTKLPQVSDSSNKEYLLPQYRLNPRIPLHVASYYPPKMAKLESGNWLSYEMHVGNYFTSSISLAGVEVLTDTASKNYLYRVIGDSLKPHFKNLTYAPDSTKMTLKPGEQGIIFFWIPLHETGPVPATLYHRILVELQGQKLSFLTTAMEVGKTTPIVLSPPLKGLWMAAQGIDPYVKSTEGHNRLLYPQFGSIRLPQRYATDWVKLGTDKKVYNGDVTKNENYYGFGAEVLAVADGIITEIQNDVPENIPPNMTVPRTQKNIVGNYIILKLKDGRSVFYGHLQTGSILVAPGKHVKSGEVLAHVGNTGNSTGAHLHFQVQDGTHFFDEGYPYTFGSLHRYGRASKQQIDSMADHGEAYSNQFEQVELKDILPVFGDIIMFK
jgi:murein DD-endopeptidase